MNYTPIHKNFLYLQHPIIFQNGIPVFLLNPTMLNRRYSTRTALLKTPLTQAHIIKAHPRSMFGLMESGFHSPSIPDIFHFLLYSFVWFKNEKRIAILVTQSILSLIGTTILLPLRFAILWKQETNFFNPHLPLIFY